ncbi:short coiled-coil protein isoform X1 [Mobula birostris]|uniref:short coiled-coil protein isoform X1 n=2 Tax=Batoidea TaxID=117893 RepID=UPI003B289515
MYVPTRHRAPQTLYRHDTTLPYRARRTRTRDYRRLTCWHLKSGRSQHNRHRRCYVDHSDGLDCLIDLTWDSGSTISDSNIDSELLVMNADMEVIDPESQVELEEKTRLINQVLELQHTLEELSARVDAVKEENLKLKSENQVLGQYIENLMSASSVFQTTDTKGKRK